MRKRTPDMRATSDLLASLLMLRHHEMRNMARSSQRKAADEETCKLWLLRRAAARRAAHEARIAGGPSRPRSTSSPDRPCVLRAVADRNRRWRTRLSDPPGPHHGALWSGWRRRRHHAAPGAEAGGAAGPAI